MNADLLLVHFNRISDAPNAVSQLRRFILDLAIRGKLIAQDSSDEPAIKLLDRIQAERMNLAKAGVIPKLAPIAGIDVDEFPFALPRAWVWARLASLSKRIHYGYTASADHSLHEVRMLRITDIQNNSVDWPTVPGCQIDAENIPQFKLEAGDVLIARTGGTIGKTFLVGNVPVTAVFASYLIRVQKASELSDRYLKLFLESSFYWEQLQAGARGGAQPNVNGQTLGRLLVPVPPVNEQHRIVTKIDELMALCDQLDAARRERESRRDRLTAAAHHHLNNGDDAESLRGHAQFFINHLPRLTARPDQIKQLRQTILNLAVRGKLAPQNPLEEAPLEPVQEIRSGDQELPRVCSAKKRPVHDVLTPEEVPFQVPENWRWVRMNAITDVQDPNPSHRMPQYVNAGGVPFISSENFAENDGINFSVGKRVSPSTLDEQIARFPILPGAIGLTRIGTIGKTRPLPTTRNYAISHAVCVLNPLDDLVLSMKFLRNALGVDAVIAFAHKGTRSIGVPDLGIKVIRNMAIPVPPLAEQRRIVAKVDKLMALCDQLEARLTTAQDEAGRLLESVLHNALTPSAVEELREVLA